MNETIVISVLCPNFQQQLHHLSTYFWPLQSWICEIHLQPGEKQFEAI